MNKQALSHAPQGFYSLSVFSLSQGWENEKSHARYKHSMSYATYARCPVQLYTMSYLTNILAFKQKQLEARSEFYAASLAYRLAVKEAVLHWQATESLSIRKCAERMTMSESSLRELLRDVDVTRSAFRHKKRT